MARIVHVYYFDKDGFLKGNIEPDRDERDIVFDYSPNYLEVLAAVRIELHWNAPNDVVELEGRHNVGYGMHIRWKTMRINSEQRWLAYKETVAESQDKALELFATKKVDADLHLDLNRCPLLVNARSPPPMNQEEMTQPDITQDEAFEIENNEHEHDENDFDLNDNKSQNVPQEVAQLVENKHLASKIAPEELSTVWSYHH